MGSIRAEEEARLNSIRQSETELARVEARIEAYVHVEQPDRAESVRVSRRAPLTSQIRLQQERSHLRDQMEEIQAEQRDANSTQVSAQNEMSDAQKRINQLESVRNMRSAAMAREPGGPDALKAVQWIHANQHRFRGRVHDPIQLSVGCRDLNYARQLEACLNKNVMRVRPCSSGELIHQTILCEHDEDYHTLSREISQYRVNIATLTNLHTLDKHPAPFDREEVRPIMFSCADLS